MQLLLVCIQCARHSATSRTDTEQPVLLVWRPACWVPSGRDLLQEVLKLLLRNMRIVKSPLHMCCTCNGRMHVLGRQGKNDTSINVSGYHSMFLKHKHDPK